MDTREQRQIEEAHLKDVLRENITPTEPISNPALLQGREAKLREIERAFNSRGAHVFIHGDRGVGKTSLALSAATLKHPSSSEPPYIGCDHSSTFYQLAHDMISQLRRTGAAPKKGIMKGNMSFGVPGIATIGATREPAPTSIPTISSINHAVDLLDDALKERREEEPVLIIDEFDQLSSDEDKRLFASFVKRLYDRRLPIRFIFCGIGESLDAITGGHLSASRPIMPVELGPVPHDARWRIVEGVAEKLNYSVNRNFIVRIGQISDGFPYYVHLIAQSLFWRIFDRGEDGRSASSEDFQLAVNEAIQQAEAPLKTAYIDAVRKTTGSKDYERVLWAIADDSHTVCQFQDIYNRYLQIITDLRHLRKVEQTEEPLSEELVRRRIYQLRDETHGRIIIRDKNSWFRFRENVVRGYVRLQAQRSGLSLGRDHF